MDFSGLKQINQSNAEQANSRIEKTERELADLRTQEVFVKSIQSLANLIQGHTTQTVVLNQLKDYATGHDIAVLDSGISALLSELKKHENTDVSPVVEALNEAITELKAIPKENPEIELPENKDYTDQFKQLLNATNDVLGAIKAQETTVEAPTVNVEAPNVQVDAPDLKPLSKDLDKSFKNAVKSIVIPKPIDHSKLLEKQIKEQQKTNKLLQEIPTGGGGSGGTSIAPFLNDSDALPTDSPSLAVRIDDSTTADTTYIGKARIGMATSAASWQIAKLDTSSGLIKTWADGDASFNNIWDDRESLTYA